MTTLAALNQYGLITAERGGNLHVSDLAVRLIHPMNDDQAAEARREAALHPKVFLELLEKGFHRCEEKVITSHLVQTEFTPLAAANVAASFKHNVEFAKLGEPGIITADKGQQNPPAASNITPPATTAGQNRANTPPQEKTTDLASAANPIPDQNRMLAQYTIPLGANQATLVFTGEELTVDDFDALIDFVGFSKKQFERAQKRGMQRTLEVIDAGTEKYPKKATWKNKDFDKDVVITGLMGISPNGVKFYVSEDGTGIPETELKFLPSNNLGDY